MKNNVIQKSIGWSMFSEVAAKLITPVTNMILARILTPSAFGVLAICNMLVSFADIITDAGFAKYLVQNDFDSEDEKFKYANVAFWANFTLSALLFLIILLCRNSIAEILGNKSYATVISIASLQLIFTSFSSIQTGLFRRKFDFKKLFCARILVAVTPLCVSIPCAIIEQSYWALIFGNLAGAIVNSVALTIMSPWRPRFYFSFSRLKKMLSFSIWSLFEGLANWLIFWVDTFIIANMYSEYYIGLYRNSAQMVISIMGMVSASMSPVLLSVLSRVKSDNAVFHRVYLSIQRMILYLIIPMGLGLFFYREIITYLLFGSKWNEASNIVGAWGLMMMCSVIFYTFPAELYKSKGIPQVLFLFQCTYLIVVVPVCMYSAKQGFWIFVYGRCLCVIEQIMMSLIFMKKLFAFSVTGLLKNMFYPTFAASSIGISYWLFQSVITSDSQIVAVFSMMLSAAIYVVVVAIFFRKDIQEISMELAETEKCNFNILD